MLLFPNVGPRLLLAKDLPDRLDVELQSPGNRLCRLLEIVPAVDLAPQIPFDHVLSFRPCRRKEQYSFLLHTENPFQDLGGYFSLPIRGHYCTPADIWFHDAPDATAKKIFERLQ